MSPEAFDWLCLVFWWVIFIGIGAFFGMLTESWMEWRREREQRLPQPEWRARVVRRWKVPE